MWHRMIHDHDPAEEFVSEADLKKYILGEPTPSKPYGFYKDGGMLITIKKPVLITSWETIFDSKASAEFAIYKYIKDDDFLIYKESIPDQPAGLYAHACNIYLQPGRYYFQILTCALGYVKSSYFNPNHCFVSFNSGYQGADIPKWTDTPYNDEWLFFFNLEISLRKADLYLGYQTDRLKDDQLLDSAFYHAPDDNSELRTYICIIDTQYAEGMKI